MKIVFQSIICSIVIHLVYVIGNIVVGFIQTINYKPDLGSSTTHLLQNEEAFGMTFVPINFVFTFFVVALIAGVVLYFKNYLVRVR